MSFYYSPVLYGINDVTIPDGSSNFEARIYYPSVEDEVLDVPILPGTYPLVAFAHGDRSDNPELCPPDLTGDYKRWGAVLHLLARCGFVVISPAMQDIIDNSEASAVRLERAINWIRSSWPKRSVLHLRPVIYMDPDLLHASRNTPSAPEQQAGTTAASSLSDRLDRRDIARLGAGVGSDIGAPIGPPTALGVAGHSWGARAAARVAARKQVQVTAIASVAGSWDENAAIDAFVQAGLPTVMMAGSDDFLAASYLPGLWKPLAAPKHQALLAGLGHWDWFSAYAGIAPCDPNTPHPVCPVGWQTASELLLGFMTKYLYNEWWRPPHLLGSPGGRPPLLEWYGTNGPCGLKIRWDDPTYTGSLGTVGDTTLGNWTGGSPW
jgi:pimeloyl-ACP methyl ester carboxylesterase